MIRAARLDLSVNLKSFSEQLRNLGVLHRIVEESGQQVIVVNSEAEAETVRNALSQWQQQDPGFDAVAAKGALGSLVGGSRSGWFYVVQQAVLGSPTTWFLMLASVTVAVISGLGTDTYTVRDLFYPLLPATNLWDLLAAIDSPVELLRTFTPMFLHFGELHLVFNMLWLWYFGKQLESLQPKWLFLLLVLVTAFISNTTQYLALQYNNFGGMSGVVYGLVGYTWVIHYFMPRSRLLISNNMFVFFVIALILMEMFASSLIATAAHVGGLIAGLLIGIVTVVTYRFVLGRSVIGKY